PTTSGGCWPVPTSSSAASPRSPRPAPSSPPRAAEVSCPPTPAAPAARSGSSERRRWYPTWAPRCAASKTTPSHWKAPAPRRPTAGPAPSAASSSSTWNPAPVALPSCSSAKPSASERGGDGLRRHQAADNRGQARGDAALDQRGHGGGVEVLLDQVGEHVVAAFPHGGEAHGGRGGKVAAGAGGQVAQERAPEGVVLEDAVPGGAAHRARRAAIEEGFAAVRGDGAVVDLVAGDRFAERGPRRAGEGLGGAEPDGGGQQAEAGDRARAAFHVVVDLHGEHLVAAADAEHRLAARRAVGD